MNNPNKPPRRRRGGAAPPAQIAEALAFYDLMQSAASAADCADLGEQFWRSGARRGRRRVARPGDP